MLDYFSSEWVISPRFGRLPHHLSDCWGSFHDNPLERGKRLLHVSRKFSRARSQRRSFSGHKTGAAQSGSLRSRVFLHFFAFLFMAATHRADRPKKGKGMTGTGSSNSARIRGLGAVEGSELAVLIREPPRADGPTRRVSLRSSVDELDVSAIARRFGGGGHRQAAGFSSDLPIDEITAIVRDGFVEQRARASA